MTEAKKKDYQLLADGIMLDGVEYHRGDTVSLDEKHGELLESHGSVGPVGILERRAEARAKADKLMADAEKAVDDARQAQADLHADEQQPVRRGPGRPPKAPTQD